MSVTLKILIALVALLHLYFLWLEMFAWTTRGKKVFKGFPPELFEPTKKLAANQGLYNGFLAAGLLWPFWLSDPVWQVNVATFFLSCVALAGIFGGITTDRKIFFIQGMPAVIALAIMYIGA